MPTKGERVLDAIRRHLTVTYGASTYGAWKRLKPEELVRIIDTELPPPKPRGPNSTSQLPDAEWLKAQKEDPRNAGIDWFALDRVFNQWCEHNKKRKTRKRYETFIRNADRHFDPSSGNQVKTYHEIRGWRLFLEERKAEGLYPDPIPREFRDLPEAIKKTIHSRKDYCENVIYKFATDHPEQWKARLENKIKERQ